MILGIDGGATATKAVLLDIAGRTQFEFKTAPSNAVLQSDDEILLVLKEIQEAISNLHLADNVEVVSLCLAGVVNERLEAKIRTVATFVWPRTKIFVSHDLMSGLYAGSVNGQGIVAISGTGASVFGRNSKTELRGGGWGHILGDGGSGYHIAHMGLRSITAQYDRDGKLSGMAKKILKATGVKTLEELSAYVSRTEKNKIAELSKFVFEAAAKGDAAAKNIIFIAASGLASNVANIARRLRLKKVPVIVTGGTFDKQEIFLRQFTKRLRRELPWAKPQHAESSGAIGAARWGLEKLRSKQPSTEKKKKEISLHELEQKVGLSSIATEERNPRTTLLSELQSSEAVDLYLSEEAQVLPAIAKRNAEIARSVELVYAGLKVGGRLIYVGAGTSGRLGVLDASECPPTFRSPPGQVQALMAGGPTAFLKAVEGAEDDELAAEKAVMELKLTKADTVCGMTASGRTPFVLAALRKAKKLGAKTILQSSNPRLLENRKTEFDVEVHFNTGPEVLSGSTRLKSGTATKIFLNMLSTLSMVKLGKVKSNFMVDLNPSNEKLKMRAIKIFQELTGSTKESAFSALEQAGWHLRQALERHG